MLLIPLLSLLFFSDVQLDNQRTAPDSVATLIAARVGAQVVYDAGDVSEHASPLEYARYAALFPYAVPVPGNHDHYLDGVYWPYGHKVDEVVGGIHVVGFDDALRLDPVEMAWLASRLNDGPMPTILFMHYPLFSANQRVGAVSSITRSAYLGMIQAAGVELCIGGHGHAYERHESEGQTFLVAGTGGADLDVVGTAPTLVVSASRHGWVEVDLIGSDLLVRFVADDGSVVDGFTVSGEDPISASSSDTWGSVKRLYLGGAR